jgi:hypothetical protein
MDYRKAMSVDRTTHDARRRDAGRRGAVAEE